MLLGVALVVEDGTKGPKSAFRYPGPRACSALSTSRLHSIDEHLGDQLDVSYSFDGGTDRGSGSGSVTSVETTSFWKFEATMFARLFRPSAALCGKIFELTIDDFHFISNPVQTEGGNITLFNLVFILESQDTQRFVSSNANQEGRAKPTLTMFRHAVAKITSALVHEQELNQFVSREVTALLKLSEEFTAGESKSREEVVVDVETSRPDMSTSADAGDGAKYVAAQNLTSGTEAGQSNGEGNGTRKGKRMSVTKKTSVKNISSTDSKLENAVKRSSLARELKNIYESLSKLKSFDVCFQGLVRVSVTLEDPAIANSINSLRPYQTLLLNDDTSLLSDPTIANSSTALLKLVEILAEKGPLMSFKDISSAIGEPLTEVFRMAAHLAYWGKGRIIDALSKLNIYRISPTAELHLRVLSDKFEGLLSRFVDKDDNRRNLITLPRILALFSMASNSGRPRVLSDHMDTAKRVLNLDSFEFVEILVWLLQQRLLTQLHQYIMLVAPNRVREAPKVLRAGDVQAVHDATMHRSISTTALSMQQDGELGPAPSSQAGVGPSIKVGSQDEGTPVAEANFSASASNISRNEVAYIHRVATDSTIYHHLKSLRPYFHGKHHMEEIMWKNNVSRETLNTVIQTYSDVLVPFLR